MVVVGYFWKYCRQQCTHADTHVVNMQDRVMAASEHQHQHCMHMDMAWIWQRAIGGMG
jgi:hypothetical protein